MLSFCKKVPQAGHSHRQVTGRSQPQAGHSHRHITATGRITVTGRSQSQAGHSHRQVTVTGRSQVGHSHRQVTATGISQPQEGSQPQAGHSHRQVTATGRSQSQAGHSHRQVTVAGRSQPQAGHSHRQVHQAGPQAGPHSQSQAGPPHKSCSPLHGKCVRKSGLPYSVSLGGQTQAPLPPLFHKRSGIFTSTGQEGQKSRRKDRITPLASRGTHTHTCCKKPQAKDLSGCLLTLPSWGPWWRATCLHLPPGGVNG
jgi:hypothetical protein